MRMLARDGRSGKAGSEALEEEAGGGDDLVARAERTATEVPISVRARAAIRWLAMTYIFPPTSKRGVSREMTHETVSTGCRSATIPRGQIMEKVGLQVQDQLAVRFQAMDAKSRHGQTSRYLASGRPCLAT